MRKTLSILLFFLISNPLSSQITLKKSVIHDSLERKFIIHLPKKFDKSKSLPLVLCFHGYTSSAEIIMSYSDFNKTSDEFNFIVVYPQGLKEKNTGKTHWNVGGWTKDSKVDDVGFVENLIDYLIVNYNINEKQIYSTGFSNGGYMSFLLACELSNRITAIASISGSMTPETLKQCAPERHVPILQVHGEDDNVVPYKGSKKWTLSINNVMNYWIKFNKCNEESIIKKYPDRVKSDSSFCILYKYINSDGIETNHIKVINGDHDWPGINNEFNINQNSETKTFFTKYDIRGNLDIKMSYEIWNFLNKYSLD
ncbi:MAG: hypothetical protein HOA52_04940 [Flavobacteriales bacterium]|nr:hypothetical protein [Flavobacteriales bacterium]